MWRGERESSKIKGETKMEEMMDIEFFQTILTGGGNSNISYVHPSLGKMNPC